MTAMHARRMMLVALAGAAPLGGASFMEGCGNAARVADGATQLDGATQADGASPEGSLDSGDAGIEPGIDAAPVPDASAPSGSCKVCPDAGEFITINGDGALQTLRFNSTPSALHDGDPSFPWSVVYYEQGLAIGGAGDPDGGASLQFDVEIKEDPDGGVTLFGPSSAYSYVYYTRQDGTLFSPTPGLSLSVTLTEADPPGGFVAGSYTATVVDTTQPGSAPLSLSGTFLTCRLCDYIGPTPPHP